MILKDVIKFVNCNYVIRVYDVEEKVVKLVGAGQLYKVIGVEWQNKLFERVLVSKVDKPTFKIRSKFVVVFHPK